MIAEIIADKYKVLAELGRGGMGRVYKVLHLGLNKVYALKILHEHLVDDENLITRFQNEARIMASLHQVNIIQVFDIDRDGNRHYFVMEYIEGQNLGDILQQRTPLPIDKVITITRQIGQALNYAHNQQPPIIHRDIKPSNIMLETVTNRVVVTDFGIAKLLDAERTRLTQSGFAVGTPIYAAPEQLRSVSNLDGQVDIFPLGLVMYEMLAGRPFFNDMTPEEVIGQKLFDPSELVPTFDASVPPALQQIIQRAIAKDREQRYHSVATLLDDLNQLESGGLAIKSKISTKPSRLRYWLPLLCITVLAGIAGYWWWMILQRPAPKPLLHSVSESVQDSESMLPVAELEPESESVPESMAESKPESVTEPEKLPEDMPPISDGLENGGYRVGVTLLDSKGGKASHNWQLKVNKPTPLPALDVAPATTRLVMAACSQQLFSINNATAYDEFQWSLNAESQSEAGSQFTFEPREAGIYAVQLQAVAGTETLSHRWQIEVRPVAITEADVNSWIARYQQALRNQDIQALRQLGTVLTEQEVAKLQTRQRYQVTIEQWNAIERSGVVELSLSQVERWYSPQTYSAVVEHSSENLELTREGCGDIVAVRK